MSSGAMTSSTLLTALRTPLPPYRLLSPSRSSTASCMPVDAPEGTIAVPRALPASSSSTATVGSPRESRISRARMSSMVVSGTVGYRRHAGQRLPFDELERRAAAGRHVRHLVGQLQLLHRLHGFASPDHGHRVARREQLGDPFRALAEFGDLKDPDRSVPQDRLGSGDHARIELDRA